MKPQPPCKNCPILNWDASRRPIPTNKGKPEKGEGFQDILDEETKKIKEEQK